MATAAIYRFSELQKIIGLSRMSVWRLEREKKFPAHIQLSPNTVGWKISEVEKWLEERARARRASLRQKGV